MDNKLPLGLCKQATMKLDSALSDLNEVEQDPEISEEDREAFREINASLEMIMAAIYVRVMDEMDEEVFINENIDMDKIDPWPGERMVEDIMDEVID